jgi:hypothetical protein
MCPQGGNMSDGVHLGGQPPSYGVSGPGESAEPIGSVVPESILTNLSALLQQIQGSAGADQVSGLATLGQQVETLAKAGHVTEGDVESLRTQLSTLAENPKLSPADQNAIATFTAALNRTPAGTLPLTAGAGGVANPFLDCSAILELFKMTSKITVELAQIQLKEALMRIHEMKLQMEAAKCAATLTKQAGEIASEKELIQAQAAYAQAGIALSGALASAVTAIGGIVSSKTAYSNYKKNNKGDTQVETHAQEAAQQAETRWSNITRGVEKVNEAAKSFTDAIMHKELSEKELQEATLKAAADFLRTLGELQGQAASTLGQSVSGLEQEIKAFFDKYIESMRGWGQAWGRS